MHLSFVILPQCGCDKHTIGHTENDEKNNIISYGRLRVLVALANACMAKILSSTKRVYMSSGQNTRSDNEPFRQASSVRKYNTKSKLNN
jgi:hypothetical protein